MSLDSDAPSLICHCWPVWKHMSAEIRFQMLKKMTNQVNIRNRKFTNLRFPLSSLLSLKIWLIFPTRWIKSEERHQKFASDDTPTLFVLKKWFLELSNWSKFKINFSIVGQRSGTSDVGLFLSNIGNQQPSGSGLFLPPLTNRFYL